MENINYYEITPEITKLADKCTSHTIDPELYTKYSVKRGLRDLSGQGVLTGLTEIGEIKAYTIDECEYVPCEGQLFYRGYDIEEIVAGFIKDDRFGFEEVTYLLLFGELPSKEELDSFCELLAYAL